MRKSMIALSCLMLSSVAYAKQAPGLDTTTASQSILSAALEATQSREVSPLQQASTAGTWMAAKSKKSTKAPAAPAQETRLADPSNRFNMTQGGKKMTADDFDAWMKKNGYRVATGAPAKSDGAATKAAK